ncbi:hypothetical protein GJ744_010609 [Endocarpon pusillum]|uniref:L-tryptophan decarboxylase PsiD-like domain-containing protein n=1 Tax=Endocarpon pusillum TaxID=364733 RepID=A0A8H7AQ56_9EURO|nr:hypothetical protein GJ744_010609 [Endocarpon pusillum]
MEDNQHHDSVLPKGVHDVSGCRNVSASDGHDHEKHLAASGAANGSEVNIDPALYELQKHIESDAGLMQLFTQAFQEIPDEFQDTPQEDGYLRIRDYRSMIDAIDRAIKKGPPWSSSSGSECVIGCPINEAMIWLMNTRTGSKIFFREDMNAHFANILSVWARYLSSADSLSVIHNEDGGWLSKDALEELLHEVNAVYNAPCQTSRFEEVFECQPSLPSYGFKSWDDFFTRRFRPNIRPIAFPADDSVVANPCESQPLSVTTNIAAKCRFLLKETSHSLFDMLDNDSYAHQFVGGTVYQGWLSMSNYHRWHAPVSGKVMKILQIRGTYYASDPSQGFENLDPVTGRPSPDRQAPDASHTLLGSVATRTVVLIRADRTDFGVVGFVAIGMAEVSSCVPTVAVGQHVSKGQDIGSFHFGGSSFCLLFQPEVNPHFLPVVKTALERPAEIGGRCIAVNSELAKLW